MLSADSDVQAVRRSIEDPAAFSEVYSRHLRTILRYLRGRLGSSAGEDATHDVFMRAFDRRDRFDPDRGAVIAWLFGIATNVVSEHRRHEAKRLKAIEREAETYGSGHGDDEVPTGLEPALAQGLRKLSLEDRETLLLMVWGELSYEEVASALAIPVGTVRSRIARARERLRGCAIAPSLSSPSSNGEAHA